MNNTDYADVEVRGLSRFFPTVLSKALLAAAAAVPAAVFQMVRSNPAWFLFEHLSALEQTLGAAVAALFCCVVVLLVLSFELATLIYSSKHRRIVHFSNEHPLHSVRFFWQNSPFRVRFCIAFVPMIFFLVGYVVS